ncbi:FadR/GntR family transcriptional regulator [Tenggerimyces flavus]|uniref:FadR/GntR family transcriptional regulator n=1 Tax=Tenggerimyces flavus TaxID=1708749 RepID=A0ABV7YPH7_9ACTN|nr:GntR family transcriptional regulator [Tenggerimyces flavus]MBM7784450.1 DNA-binding FadR family transcriptional regulator [Tenggerimyces flavus]
MPEPGNDPLADIAPVVVRSAAAQVADGLVLLVREEKLKPDDKLPSERDLATRFKVSRPTVREALAALELAGVVRSYRGRGTIVVGTPSQVATWGVEIFPPQVFEARLAIEPQLAALAARKHYPVDLAYLQQALADHEKVFQTTGEYPSDLPIHRAIARAARNPILERALEDALLHTQSPLWMALRARAFATQEARASHSQDLHEVVKFIGQGKPAEAAHVWRHHLFYFRADMLGRTHGSAD